MSKEKTPIFKFPCVYTINVKDEPKFYWSNTNQNGNFGIKKFIWVSGTSTGSIIDSEGKYGLTEFGYAIEDKLENLPLIKKVFDSPEFKTFMTSLSLGVNGINTKYISLFKKDFYKTFLSKYKKIHPNESKSKSFPKEKLQDEDDLELSELSKKGSRLKRKSVKRCYTSKENAKRDTFRRHMKSKRKN